MRTQSKRHWVSLAVIHLLSLPENHLQYKYSLSSWSSYNSSSQIFHCNSKLCRISTSKINTRLKSRRSELYSRSISLERPMPISISSGIACCLLNQNDLCTIMTHKLVHVIFTKFVLQLISHHVVSHLLLTSMTYKLALLRPFETVLCYTYHNHL